MYNVGTLRAAFLFFSTQSRRDTEFSFLIFITIVILSIAKDLGSIHVDVSRSFTPFRMTRFNNTLGCRRQ